MQERQLEREFELQQDVADRRIAEIRARVPADRMGPEHCADCGNDIHIDRRMHGYNTCIECATAKEKLGRRYKGAS